MSRLVLGFDGDGVIVDIGQFRSTVLWLMFRKKVPVNLCRRSYLLSQGILTEQEYEDFGHEVYCGDKYARLLRLVGGAAHYLERILNLRHQIVVATRRPDSGVQVVRQLLDRYSLSLDIHSVPNGNSKAVVVGNTHAYFDDDVGELRQLIGSGPRLYLFDQPYNGGENIASFAAHVSSWENIYHMVGSWSE